MAKPLEHYLQQEKNYFNQDLVIFLIHFEFQSTTGPLVPGIEFVEFGNILALEAKFQENLNERKYKT
jgi:hypothetical protein